MTVLYWAVNDVLENMVPNLQNQHGTPFVKESQTRHKLLEGLCVLVNRKFPNDVRLRAKLSFMRHHVNHYHKLVNGNALTVLADALD
jgi:hypothetical protein